MAAPPMLLTDDELLAADVSRLAAAAGIDLVVERDPARALSTWSIPAAVLVGADAAPMTSSVPPPRRDHVHVLCRAQAPDALFRQAVALGAASVLELPEGEPWLAELLADLGDGAEHTGTTVAVVGGAGGVGASTFAASLAVRAARSSSTRTGPGADGSVALVDLDPLGPGLLRLLGRDDEPGVTWPELADSRGRLGARALRAALPSRDGVGVLCWPQVARAPRAMPPPAVLREVVSAARRGHAWVVLDVPRHTCSELAPVLSCDLWLLVVPSGVAAVASAARVVGLLRDHGADVHLVVRDRGAGTDGAAVTRVLGVPVAASVGRHRRLDEHLDLGLGPLHGRRNPVAAGADQVLATLSAARLPGER